MQDEVPRNPEPDPGVVPSDPGPFPGEAPAEPEAVVEEAPDGAGPDDALARVVAERDRYLEALQRLKAEFDNYRKRAERDRQAQAAGVEQDLIKSLLPVVDNLERAVAALDQAGDLSTGVDMVRVQLADVLAGRGLERIDAEGAQFDPHFHEAVAKVPAPGQPAGTVVEVIQTGYKLGDHVIRPSTVVVADAG